jgi:hypothetical protein
MSVFLKQALPVRFHYRSVLITQQCSTKQQFCFQGNTVKGNCIWESTMSTVFSNDFNFALCNHEKQGGLELNGLSQAFCSVHDVNLLRNVLFQVSKETDCLLTQLTLTLKMEALSSGRVWNAVLLWGKL